MDRDDTNGEAQNQTSTSPDFLTVRFPWAEAVAIAAPKPDESDDYYLAARERISDALDEADAARRYH